MLSAYNNKCKSLITFWIDDSGGPWPCDWYLTQVRHTCEENLQPRPHSEFRPPIEFRYKFELFMFSNKKCLIEYISFGLQLLFICFNGFYANLCRS